MPQPKKVSYLFSRFRTFFSSPTQYAAGNVYYRLRYVTLQRNDERPSEIRANRTADGRRRRPILRLLTLKSNVLLSGGAFTRVGVSKTALSKTSVVIKSERRFVGINGRFVSETRRQPQGEISLSIEPCAYRNTVSCHSAMARETRWTDEENMIENDFPSVRLAVLVSAKCRI